MTLFITWLVLTLLSTGVVLHEVGKRYGAHVAMSTDTRVAVFMGVGTAWALGIGLTRWLAL